MDTPSEVIGLAGLRVVMATASMHTMALTSCGQVYTFGPGHNGELGLGDPKAHLYDEENEYYDEIMNERAYDPCAVDMVKAI